MLNRGGAALSAIVTAAALVLAPPAAPAAAATDRAGLALRWAPIHYQDVDATGGHALGGRSDFITTVDFDGDFNGRNNWDRAADGGASFAAHYHGGLTIHQQRPAYYSVLETGTPGGLWAQRDNGALFAGLGTFAGDASGGCGTGTWSCGTNSANAPWGWDDGNDVPARGEIAADPAALVGSYFTVPGALSRSYGYNPYAGEAAALKAAARTAPPIRD